MTKNILFETVIRFLRGEPKNAELALLVVDAIPVLKTRIRDEVLWRIRNALTEFVSPESSAWALKVHEKGKRMGRLHLFRKDREQWWSDHNHGVWFIWEDVHGIGGAGGWVGVEWPVSAESFVKKSDLVRLFPNETAPSQAGRRHEGDKEWFARPPCGSEWIGWAHLLGKSEEELQEYGDRVADFMVRLAEAIDAAEAGHSEANGH